MSADGKDIGTVKQLGDTCFRIAAKRRRDFWLANSAVEGRDAGIAVLYFESNRLGDAAVDVSAHTGQHSHPKMPSEGGGPGIVKPLLVMAGLGAMALRDEQRRKKALEVAREGATRVKTKLNEARDKREGSGESQSTYGATSTVGGGNPRPAPVVDPSPGPPPGVAPEASTASPTAEERKAREAAIVREVTLAFPTMDLRVTPMAVHNLSGDETETLRFTLDETASSDLELARIAHSAESDSTLANELISDLRTQLPPGAGQAKED
jgi:hypothetical protein